MGDRGPALPLTDYQRSVARSLAKNRSEDSYLAGGAALHIEPNTKRYSNDLDYFQDSVERVGRAFADDEATLVAAGHRVELQLKQPGFIRAIVSKGEHATKVDWAHDSAWRFMPTIRHPDSGYQLHPIDLAVNKVLALTGRNEPRDFIDILVVDEEVLGLGALCWAAAGKDPGFTPRTLLDLLRRRGRYRPDDFARLDLAEPVDLVATKERWLEMLAATESFIDSRPPEEVGCLYYSRSLARFIQPDDTQKPDDIVQHHGRPGGVLPQLVR